MFALGERWLRLRWVLACVLLAGLISWWVVGRGSVTQENPQQLFKCSSPACGHVFKAKPQLGQIKCPRCEGRAYPAIECPQCGQRVIPNGYLGRPGKTYCPNCGVLLEQQE